MTLPTEPIELRDVLQVFAAALAVTILAVGCVLPWVVLIAAAMGRPS